MSEIKSIPMHEKISFPTIGRNDVQVLDRQPGVAGGTKRVVLGRSEQLSQEIAIKLPRYDFLKQLTASEKDGDSLDSDKRIKRYNEIISINMQIAKIASLISPAVAKPLAYYQTSGGLKCETYRAYEGKMPHDINYGEFFTSEQIDYFLQEKKRLEDHGLYGKTDELLLGNVMRIGDGPTDIVFIEPPTQIRISEIKVENEYTGKIRSMHDLVMVSKKKELVD